MCKSGEIKIFRSTRLEKDRYLRKEFSFHKVNVNKYVREKKGAIIIGAGEVTLRNKGL